MVDRSVSDNQDASSIERHDNGQPHPRTDLDWRHRSGFVVSYNAQRTWSRFKTRKNCRTDSYFVASNVAKYIAISRIL